MRFSGLMIAAGLWGALVLTGAMAADLPRTVEEQAESIGDGWAAYLSDEYGEALPTEDIVGPRAELVEGLRNLLREPLTRDRFDCVEGWTMVGLTAWVHPPLELQLREHVRTVLYDVERFLPRPFPDGEMIGRVGFQLGELYYLLQQHLAAGLAPTMEDPAAAGKAVAGGIVMGGYQQLLPQLRNPVSPVLKRALTAEEVAQFEVRAWEISQVHRDALQERLARLHTTREATTEEVRHEAWVAASDLSGELQRLFLDERPPMLSPQEQEALDEALRPAGSSAPAGETLRQQIR